MSSQSELKAEMPSSEAPLPSSPSPVKTQDAVSEELDGHPKIQRRIDTEPATKTQDTVPQQSTVQSSLDTKSNPENLNLPNPEAPTNPRLQSLESKRLALESKLSDLQSQRSELVSKTTLPSGLAMPADWTEEQKTQQALATANGVIKEHIALLHSYNEIKDIGLGLLGLVAEKRGVRQATVMEEYEMGPKD